MKLELAEELLEPEPVRGEISGAGEIILVRTMKFLGRRTGA